MDKWRLSLGFWYSTKHIPRHNIVVPSSPPIHSFPEPPRSPSSQEPVPCCSPFRLRIGLLHRPHHGNNLLSTYPTLSDSKHSRTAVTFGRWTCLPRTPEASADQC